MSDILLHPTSRTFYDKILTDMPQALLLVAPEGSGKEYVLKSLAFTLLGRNHSGRIFDIEPDSDKKSIGIETIRELKISVKLKSAKSRVVLIPHAELLTTEAQNSLLKLLEEPPTNVHFMLASPKINDIIETIQSRVIIWNLTLPSSSQIHEYYAEYSESARNKAIAIGESRMGLIEALLKDQDNHDLVHAIDTAKEILGENHFNRMTRVDGLSKDANMVNELLDAFRLVCGAAMNTAAKNNSNSVKQWHKRLKLVVQADEWLDAKVQPKLVLSYLFMQL